MAKTTYKTGRTGSLDDFARAAGMRPGIIQDIESGEHVPDAVEKKHLERARQMTGSETDPQIQQT